MPPLTLDADLGIESASGLKTLLTAQLGHRRNVVIDAAAVERVHTASLQLLCAFVRERNTADMKTRLDKASPQFLEAARVLGLEHALGLDEHGDSR